MVTPNLPCPTSGANTRNYYLLKALAREHAVSLLALVGSNEEVESNMPLLAGLTGSARIVTRSANHSKRLGQLTHCIRGKSYILETNNLLEVQEALDELVTHDQYDAVLFESVLIAGYRLPGGVKVIVDQHNIEYELLQRTYQRETAWSRKWYNWLESRFLKPIEIERCRQADVVLVTSQREYLLLKNMLPRNVIKVVPNGVDIEIFQQVSPKETSNQIIFTGAMDYYPNIDAVLFFAEQCWPLIQSQVPGASWQIVGRNPPPEVWKLAQLPGVTVTGSVPDVRPYLAASAVAVAPLRIGSGTRLKILEALAMQKAVVSTSIGCEGLTVEPGKHLMVADQPEAFAQSIMELLHKPAMRAALGSAGRALVEADYGWERCGSQLLHVLEEIC